MAHFAQHTTTMHKKLSYSAVLIALGVGLGYALAWAPNIELVSFIAVLSGVMLGGVWGTIDGALVFLLFSFLSPFGLPPFPLWLAQGIGGACLGFGGSIFGKRLKNPLFAIMLAIAGTLLYDVLTNAAGYFTFPTGNTFIIYIIGGLSFSLLHILSNSAIFAILFPLLTRMTIFKKRTYRKAREARKVLL